MTIYLFYAFICLCALGFWIFFYSMTIGAHEFHQSLSLNQLGCPGYESDWRWTSDSTRYFRRRGGLIAAAGGRSFGPRADPLARQVLSAEQLGPVPSLQARRPARSCVRGRRGNHRRLRRISGQWQDSRLRVLQRQRGGAGEFGSGGEANGRGRALRHAERLFVDQPPHRRKRRQRSVRSLALQQRWVNVHLQMFSCVFLTFMVMA